MTSADEVIRRQVGRDPARLELRPGDDAMLAVVTTGNGGLDQLDYREVRRPRPDEGEVLVRVLAAGVNATDVNTRGRAGTRTAAGAPRPPFPFIQGTDCCGLVAEVGPGGDRGLAGPPRPRAAVHAPARLRVDGDGLAGLRLRRRLRPVRARAGVRGLPGAQRASATPSSASCRARSARRRTCWLAPASARGSTWSSPAPPAASARRRCSSRGCAAPRSPR